MKLNYSFLPHFVVFLVLTIIIVIVLRTYEIPHFWGLSITSTIVFTLLFFTLSFFGIGPKNVKDVTMLFLILLISFILIYNDNFYLEVLPRLIGALIGFFLIIFFSIKKKGSMQKLED